MEMLGRTWVVHGSYTCVCKYGMCVCLRLFDIRKEWNVLTVVRLNHHTSIIPCTVAFGPPHPGPIPCFYAPGCRSSNRNQFHEMVYPTSSRVFSLSLQSSWLHEGSGEGHWDPVIRFMAGHASHINLELIRFTRDCGVILLCLPSHTHTHTHSSR